MYAKKRHLKQLGYQEVNTRIFVNVFDAARKYHRILILATDTDVVDLESLHEIYIVLLQENHRQYWTFIYLQMIQTYFSLTKIYISYSSSIVYCLFSFILLVHTIVNSSYWL